MSPFLLVALCVFIALALPGFAFYVTRRTTRADAETERLRIFQHQWRSAVLNEDPVARRLMDVITAPAVKRNLHISITVDPDFESRAMEETSMFVSVETDFEFVNVGRREVIFSIDPSGAAEDRDAGRRLTALSVDSVEFALSDQEQIISIPAGTRRAIRTTSRYQGSSPYVAMFPQNVPVLGGAEVKVISYTGQPIRLTVVGRDDPNCQAQARPTTQEATSVALSIPGPLLPGDTIMFTVGV